VVEDRHIRHLRILVLLGHTAVVEVQFLVQDQVVDQLMGLSFLHLVQEEVVALVGIVVAAEALVVVLLLAEVEVAADHPGEEIKNNFLI
tara:strand:- start:185 stop:451 length:267 start_codon:yes stop_codon:yes gene_type:complete